MNPPPPAPGHRVGLREIAAAAGVCLMTASLALRNNPKITAATRQRVRDWAARLGYRPDPEISRLMGRLRASRRAPGSVVIAMIELRAGPTLSLHPYDVSIRRGITQRADALGLGVSLFRIAEYDGSVARTVRVIRARGINGIILLPSSEPIALDPAIDWDGLSVVAATTCVVSPRFNQVAPNQLHNMLTLVARLHARGLQRIGAVLNPDIEERTHHYYSLALSWHGHRERILVLNEHLAPEVRRTCIRDWFETQAPDAIIAHNALDVAGALNQAPRLTRTRPLIVALGGPKREGFPYHDQLPELIGESAVSLVNGMMHNHDTGIPAHPHITTIDGVLRGLPASV